MKHYALLLLWCGGALATQAQSTAFTYQGRLAESGAPFSGLADLQFTLFSAPTGGVALGASVSASVNVTDGLFTVPLDFGAAAFPGADRFLQIAARTNGGGPFTALSPRQPLTATPYATRAANFSGGVSDSQLSANMARLNGNETFSGTVNFSSVSNNFAGSFTGNGALPWQVVSGTSQPAQSILGQIYTSTDSGTNWIGRDTNRIWIAAASSSDGDKLVAVVSGGQIYTSTDSGTNWTARESARQWVAVASSSEGGNLVAAVAGGQIYTSIDSGVDWTPRDSNRNWQSVASSANGTKLAAVPFGGQIYVSTDSGASWTPRLTDTNRGWYAVASSADGSKLVAGVRGGQIYTSTDSGVTWIPRDSDRTWQSVASSDDGSKLIAAVVNGNIFTSTAPTTAGTTGFLIGGQGAAIELQYIGNDQFLALSHQGTIGGN